jgi:ketosteroid isomerase-like protein
MKQPQRSERHPTSHERAQSDAAQVKDLVERWAKSVSAGDRAGIRARHSRDLLMFDFPAVVRGIDAYDQTWDFFFANPQGPISFVPDELQVTASDDVAFASCLIRCDGTSAGHVDLRLTVGLRKIDGQWTVTHEHHSVPTIEQRFLDPAPPSWLSVA